MFGNFKAAALGILAFLKFNDMENANNNSTYMSTSSEPDMLLLNPSSPYTTKTTIILNQTEPATTVSNLPYQFYEETTKINSNINKNEDK
ncbi:hypothetical protein COBT_001948, partial [Conglomerata obtusa]